MTIELAKAVRPPNALLLAASGLLIFSQSATAQGGKAATDEVLVGPPFSCPPDIDNYHDWMPERRKMIGDRKPVPKEAVHEIDETQRTRAVALLDRVEFLELTSAQADELIGSGVSSGQHGTAFLVRNVVPGLAAMLGRGPVTVEQVGSGLLIGAGLFGCGGFLKSPVVVFLPSALTHVDMDVHVIW